MDAETRVLKTLEHEEPDRVPACESDFTNITIAKHYMGPNASIYGVMDYIGKLYRIPYISKIMNILRSHTNIGVNAFKSITKLFRALKIDLFPAFIELQPWKFINGGFIDNFGRKMQIETYPGDISKVIGYHGGTFKNLEDFKTFSGYPNPNDSFFLKTFLDLKKFQREELDNEIFIIPAIFGLMEATWEGFGIEVFSRIISRSANARKIFDERGKLALEMTKIYAENDAKVIWIYDDYGYKKGLFMSPRSYHRYVIPWIKKICAIAHKHDCKIVLHSCGDIEPIFGNLVDAGVDAFNPIEPTTANPEYDIFKLNKKFGDQITFIGNIAPQLLASGTAKEIEDYSKKLIKNLAPNGGFIFASGHSINPAISLENFQLILKIREKYGSYPIDVPI
jgi:uroporphyrinogen decarboxylase